MEYEQEVVGYKISVIITDGYEYTERYLVDSLDSAKNLLAQILRSRDWINYEDKDLHYLETLGELSDNDDDLRLLNIALDPIHSDLEKFYVKREKVYKVTKA